MKPQALQDAIKAAAAKKRNKVDTGGWKEPVVKTHKMTADEFQSSRSKRPQSPPEIPSSPSYTTSSTLYNGGLKGAEASTELLRKLEKEIQEYQREKKDLLKEMKAHRNDMSVNMTIVSSLQKEMDHLKSKIEKQEKQNKRLQEKVRNKEFNGSSSALSVGQDVDMLERRIEQLEDENRHLKEKFQSGWSSELEKLRAKVAWLEDETKLLSEKTKSLAGTSATPFSPSVGRITVDTPRSPATSKVANVSPRSPATPSKPAVRPKTPTHSSSSTQGFTVGDSSSNGWPYLKPHTAEKISKYQARDEALKAYLANPNAPIGMYPRKTMSVETIDGKSLVFFRSKIYIPEKLREKHMHWYIEEYKENAKEKLMNECTWPHQEREMFDFVRNHS